MAITGHALGLASEPLIFLQFLLLLVAISVLVVATIYTHYHPTD